MLMKRNIFIKQSIDQNLLMKTKCSENNSWEKLKIFMIDKVKLLKILFCKFLIEPSQK